MLWYEQLVVPSIQTGTGGEEQVYRGNMGVPFLLSQTQDTRQVVECSCEANGLDRSFDFSSNTRATV